MKKSQCKNIIHLQNTYAIGIGASLPKNVVACAMDLAKYNNMSLGDLFTEYEG